MEEISTPVETVVEDTSVTSEPVETTTDTSDTVTEPEQTTTEPTAETEPTEPTPKEEELYAGKYKSVEELVKGYKEAEKSFSRVAELEKKIQEYESRQPKYVNENGKFNPEIKAQYDREIDNREFLTYADYARSLAPEERAEVERLLGEAQRVYNPQNKQAYLSKLAEAKNYFNSDLVENIARSRIDLEHRALSEMRGYEAKARQTKADYFANEIQKEPELYSLVNPENPEHSPEVLAIVKSMFDAYQNINVPQTMAAINKIKELGVKQYLAKQEFEAKKSQANVNSGNTVSSTTASGLPTAEYLVEHPETYGKYAKKYGVDKIDAIIMKG